MAEPILIFRMHTVRRMFRRGVTEQDVRAVLSGGEVIQQYPDDLPFASPVYNPDPARWSDDFRTRRRG